MGQLHLNVIYEYLRRKNLGSCGLLFVKIYVLLLFIFCDEIDILLVNNYMFVIKWVWPGCQSVSAKSKSEQCSKISLLRNNSSYAHCCLQCCGSTLLPPPLELVVQSEARSAAHRLCSLWCWSYLQPNRAHSSILMRLQQSDPIFKWGLTLWGQHTNLDTNIRLPCWRGRIGLKQLVLLLQSKARLVYWWVQDEGGGGTVAGVYGQSVGRRLSFFLDGYGKFF